MKTVVIIAVVVLAALAIGGFVISQNSSNEEQKMAKDSAMMADDSNSSDSMQKDAMEDTEAMMEDKMATDEAGDDAMMAKGVYVPYTDDAFEEASDTDRILYFYASWCPTCRPVDQELQENVSQIPEGVTVIRVNYEDPETDASEEALADEYGITYQHTFVRIDSEGNQITKWNGGDLEELLENIN